jgi:hypothetical protein
VSHNGKPQTTTNTNGDNKMKETLTTNEIARKLREDENAGWSYAGALALAEYLEEVDREGEQEMEFDRVAIRCDFSEYTSATEAASDYAWEPDKDNDEEQNEEAALDFLQNRTTAITFDGGVIIQNF